MKNIVVTQRLIENKNSQEIRDALDIRWADLFRVLDYIPVLLPTYYDFRQYFNEFKIDGIILTGGNNLSMFLDNKVSEKRDAFEREIIGFAIQREIPVLGICRGMQVIVNYFCGEIKKVDGHARTRHGLVISEESRFKDDLARLGSVNSYHNYGVTDVKGDLIPSARSEDGIVEAIEHKRYKIFGQMWHSERESPLCKEELNIMKKLF